MEERLDRLAERRLDLVDVGFLRDVPTVVRGLVSSVLELRQVPFGLDAAVDDVRSSTTSLLPCSLRRSDGVRPRQTRVSVGTPLMRAQQNKAQSIERASPYPPSLS